MNLGGCLFLVKPLQEKKRQRAFTIVVCHMHVASDSVLVANHEGFGIILNFSFRTLNMGTEKVEPQAAASAQWGVTQLNPTVS